MDSLISWISENQMQAKVLMSAIIGLVAIIYCGLAIIKAIAAGKGSKMNEMWKQLGIAAFIIAIAAVGIGGVFLLVNMLLPNDSVLPSEKEFQINGAPAHVQIENNDIVSADGFGPVDLGAVNSSAMTG